MGRMRIQRRRAGYSLLELVASSAIAAAVVVPAMVAMRQSLEMSRGVTKTNTITTLCVGKMEQHLVSAASDFTNGKTEGSFESDGQPNVRYEVEQSDSPGKGGRPGELMAVHVVIWDDANDNQKMDADERRIKMSSKVAKLASYQSEAGKGK